MQNVTLSVLSASEEKDIADIKVYPNPVISTAMIDFSEEIINGEVVLSDINGKLLVKIKII